MVKKFLDFFFFITAAGLYFGLKNVVVLKSPNSKPESIYLATQTQMHINRSHQFNFFMLLFMFPQGLGIQGFYKQGFSLCYSSLIYVWGPIVVLGPISQGTN
jgi:hypothetical protein